MRSCVSHLVGQSEGSPVDGHRLFGLKVLVNLDRLFWVHVLPLHHVSIEQTAH